MFFSILQIYYISINLILLSVYVEITTLISQFHGLEYIHKKRFDLLTTKSNLFYLFLQLIYMMHFAYNDGKVISQKIYIFTN